MAEVLHSPTHFSSSPSPLTHDDDDFIGQDIADDDTSRVADCITSLELAKERENVQGDELSLLTLLMALLKRVLMACKTDKREQLYSSCDMEIGCPTNVSHVAHVTFDRFSGFLGLPLDLVEAELLVRAPSSSATVFGVSPQVLQLSHDNHGNNIPTILLLMQRSLYVQGGLQAEGIFRINAENSQEESVREQINRGLVPDGTDVHCLAGLIKAWFRELPTGVLDPLSPEKVMQCQTENERAWLAKDLPPTESALLNWAVNLMADVVLHEHANKMNSRNIAMVFAPNMTKMADPLTALMYAVQVMNFLKSLIERSLRERESIVEPDFESNAKPSDENGDRDGTPPVAYEGESMLDQQHANHTTSPEGFFCNETNHPAFNIGVPANKLGNLNSRKQLTADIHRPMISNLSRVDSGSERVEAW